MFGVDISTVAGKLRIIGRSGVGFQMSITASHARSANGSSVPVKLSGEYSKRMSVPVIVSAKARICRVPRSAMATIPSSSRPKTTRRCSVEVEL